MRRVTPLGGGLLTHVWEVQGNSEPGVFEADKNYTFKYPRPQRPRSLRIYECHVGMSTEEEKVNSYMEFRADMIPRIRRLGYNTIQTMAIQVRTPPACTYTQHLLTLAAHACLCYTA